MSTTLKHEKLAIRIHLGLMVLSATATIYLQVGVGPQMRTGRAMWVGRNLVAGGVVSVKRAPAMSPVSPANAISRASYEGLPVSRTATIGDVPTRDRATRVRNLVATSQEARAASGARLSGTAGAQIRTIQLASAR